MARTQHTCGGPKFGRKTAGCPRCDELLADAEPVRFGAPDEDRPRTTQHTHQVVYGRRVAGCPRCAELDAGAEPVRWAHSRREQDERRAEEIRDHFTNPNSPHLNGGCGPVCTYGDW